MTFEPELSHRINFQLTPQENRKLDLSADMKELDKLTESIKTESPKFVYGHYVVSSSVTVIIIVILLALLAIYWFTTRKQPSNRTVVQAEATVAEQIEMPTLLTIEAEAEAGKEQKSARQKCRHR
jgi:hypothetical protein